MKKTIAILLLLISIVTVLVSCGNKEDIEGTSALHEKIIGKTFSGSYTSTTSSAPFDITSTTQYTFKFTNENTVVITKAVATEYGSAYTDKKDTKTQSTENAYYAVKKTQAGDAYVFIGGFGSDGKDTSDNDEGLKIAFDSSGEISSFVYETLLNGFVRMYVQ